MARPKKPTYEWVEKLQCYRKRIKDVDGMYFAIYSKDPDELTRKISEAKAAISQAQTAKGNPTVAEYAKRWLPLQVAGLSTSAAESYERALRIHIIPKIGQMKLRDVTQDDAREILRPLLCKSKSLHMKVLGTLRNLFDAAVDNHIIASSPITKIKGGGIPAAEKEALTADAVTILLEAVHGTRAEVFVLLGLYAGLRREEILGLQWADVDLSADAPHLVVRHALRWEQSRPILSETLKSDAAYRNIPIPARLVTALSDMDRGGGPYVIGGTALSKQQFRNLWRIVERREVGASRYTERDGTKVAFIREKGQTAQKSKVKYVIDFKVTPHLLRHTYISNLILGGVDVKTVQYLAGHSSVQMTLNVYAHVISNRPDDMIAKIRAAFPEVNSTVEVSKSG